MRVVLTMLPTTCNVLHVIWYLEILHKQTPLGWNFAIPEYPPIFFEVWKTPCLRTVQDLECTAVQQSYQ